MSGAQLGVFAVVQVTAITVTMAYQAAKGILHLKAWHDRNKKNQETRKLLKES